MLLFFEPWTWFNQWCLLNLNPWWQCPSSARSWSYLLILDRASAHLQQKSPFWSQVTHCIFQIPCLNSAKQSPRPSSETKCLTERCHSSRLVLSLVAFLGTAYSMPPLDPLCPLKIQRNSLFKIAKKSSPSPRTSFFIFKWVAFHIGENLSMCEFSH